MADPEDDEVELGGLFTPPAGFYPPLHAPSVVVYERDASVVPPGQTARLELGLIGQHSLWGHHLWNAGIEMARYLDSQMDLRGLRVLELGAGAALPSVIAALRGASRVVASDYPDAPLVENMERNLARYCPDGRAVAVGYMWGSRDTGAVPHSAFDLILLSDLVFNHSQHEALIETCLRALDRSAVPEASVLVFFSHHRPHLAHKDLAFFDVARERGFSVQEFATRTYTPMFENDPGSVEVRSTVHCYRMTLGRHVDENDQAI